MTALAYGWRLVVMDHASVLIDPAGAMHYPSDLLSVAQVAELYGVGKSRVHGLLRERRMSGTRYGNMILIPVREALKCVVRVNGRPRKMPDAA